MSDKDRATLINSMLDARTEEDLRRAEREADDWLEENPEDHRVIAAQERMARTAERVRDPERVPNRLSVFSLLVAALVTGLVVGVLTSDWKTALQVAVVVGMSVGAVVWLVAGGVWRQSL